MVDLIFGIKPKCRSISTFSSCIHMHTLVWSIGVVCIIIPVAVVLVPHHSPNSKILPFQKALGHFIQPKQQSQRLYTASLPTTQPRCVRPITPLSYGTPHRMKLLSVTNVCGSFQPCPIFCIPLLNVTVFYPSNQCMRYTKDMNKKTMIVVHHFPPTKTGQQVFLKPRSPCPHHYCSCSLLSLRGVSLPLLKKTIRLIH